MHQEMPQGDERGRMHGFQLWANLPASQKMTRPRYQDVAARDIPELTDDDGTRVRVVCGTFLYLGRIVEISPKAALYKKPLHPYTEALLSAVPIPDPVLEKKRQVKLLSGDVPSPLNSPSGCAFHPRCTLRVAACEAARPELAEVMSDHWVACLVRGGEKAAEKAYPLTPPS